MQPRSFVADFMRLRRVGAVLGVTLATSCANIESIPLDTCGNSIVEEDRFEDCDVHDVLGMKCRPAREAGGCRFDCTNSACAPGYACGADNICRSSSGDFEATTRLDGGARVLLPGDYDGDGITDVFAATAQGSVLHYLGADHTAQLSEDVLLDLRDSDFIPAELTNDGRADLLTFDAQQGIGVLRGSATRALAPTTYPSFPIPGTEHAFVFTLEALENTPEDASVPLPGKEPVALATIALSANNTLTLPILAQLDSSVPTDGNYLIGNGKYGPDHERLPSIFDDGGAPTITTVPSARLDETFPCDQYVMAFRGSGVAVIGTPCDLDGKPNGTLIEGTPIPPNGIYEPIEIDLPTGFEVGIAALDDVDADGDVDVVIAPNKAGPAVVALGPFDLQSTVAHPTVTYGRLELQSSSDQRSTNDEHLLALEDLNADGEADFVTSYGIYLSRQPIASGAECPLGGQPRPASLFLAPIDHCAAIDPLLATSTTEGWAETAIADFNDNGILDVALVRSADMQLTIFSGAAEDTFVRLDVGTDGYPVHLVAGDFDGDSYADLAFTDRPCSSSDCEAANEPLAVSFGHSGVGVDDPVLMGLLPRIDQILATSIVSPEAQIVDGATDLGIMSSVELAEGTQLSFSLLLGNPSRLLQAPFRLLEQVDLPGPGGDTDLRFLPYTPLATVSGQFADMLDSELVSGAEHADIITLARTTGAADFPELAPPRARVWLSVSQTEAELSLALGTTSEPLDERFLQGSFISAAALALDIDDDQTDEAVFLGSVAGSETGTLLVADVVDGEIVTRITELDHEFLTVGRSNTRLSRPTTLVRDVDADGQPDIVTFAYDFQSLDDLNQRLIVLYNAFGTTGSVFESYSAAESAEYIVEPGRLDFAFEALNLDDDEALEIVVLGADSSYVLDLDPNDRSVFLPITQFTAIASAPRAIAVLNLDDDGLSDLAVGYEGYVELLLNSPTNR